MSERTNDERQIIYEEERARREDKESSYAHPERREHNTPLPAGLCTLIILAAVGSLAYQHYQSDGAKQKLSEAFGKDRGLTETILKVESESSKITYGEILELCNKSLENRTSLIVELRGLYPELDHQFKLRLVDYLSSENEFVRAKREFYRKSMEQSAATTAYLEQGKDYPSSIYGWDFYKGRIRQARVQLMEAADKAYKSADDFLKVYEKMAKEEVAMTRIAQDAGLRFEPIFQNHATANRKRANETKAEAQQLARLN